MRYALRIRIALVLSVAVLPWFAPAGPKALAAPTADGQRPEANVHDVDAPRTDVARTALMVFLDYEQNVVPMASPTELRLAGAGSLAADLEARGQEVLTYPEIEPAMQSWGARSDLDLPAGLLATLVEKDAVDNVMIVRIILYRDRILLLARGLDATTGNLYWADAEEIQLEDEFWTDEETTIARWKGHITSLGKHLDERWTRTGSVDAGTTIVVLPLRPIGLGEQSAALASHALLGVLLSTGTYRIPDPALVQTVLRSQGLDPLALGHAGREGLQARFAPASLVAPELVSFESAPPSGVNLIEEDGNDASPASASRKPLYFQVLGVDCGTGQVLGAEAVYLEPDNPVGLFGVSRQIPLARRFEDGAKRIVQNLRARGGSI